ncbi:MAG: kelch repeat-containing protein [Candidatus Kapaibacterium sp.]
MKTLLLFSLFLLTQAAFSQNTPSWRVVGNLSSARVRHESVYIGNNRILVFGGHTAQGITTSCEIIDFVNNTITPTASMRTPRAEFASLMTPDSLILAIGGVTNISENVTTSIEAYDFKTGLWVDFGNLVVPRRQFTVVKISTDEFLVAGGRENGTVTINSAEIFNIKTRTSRRITNLPVLANNPSSGISSQDIPLVFGGRAGGTGSSQSGSVYHYDEVQKKWIITGTIPTPTEYAPTIKMWDGRLAYTGGNNESLQPTNWLNDIALESNNSFIKVGAMKVGRHTHFLAQWDQNKILTGGGKSGLSVGNQSLSSTEWFDIQTLSVTPGPEMNVAHAISTWNTIPIYQNGIPVAAKIVVISGYTKFNQYTPVVEILEMPSRPPDTVKPCDESYEMTHKLPNKYAPVLSVSNDRLQVTIPKDITFCPDNKLLIIQMRGADVQSVPGSSYGSVTSYNDAGNYEFCRISSVNGNVLTLSKPLSRTYNPAGKVQVVRVPEFRNYTLADTLYCPQWNDTVYGVVALAVVDTLHLVAPIIANGSGFPGGLVVNAKSTDSTHLDVYFGAEDSSRYALKGQGIASFLSAEHRAGRGALAIAGGGGNNHNAGGGGGANGGCGGKGGYGWDEMKAGNNLLAQGLGGYAADNTTNKLFMGGGGGAGHSNERTGTSGGNGGGIVIIDARYIAAEGGTIFANGITAGNAPYDGAGGGGAGGTVLLKTSAILGQLTIEAQGGNGGKVAIHRDGPGGGGGGGVVCFSLPATPTGATIVNTGGYAGTSRNFEEYGQSDGCTGVQRTNIEIPGDNTILSVSSAPDEEASAPHVYPQPARDMVTLLPPNGSPAAKRCSLFDMLGHHVGEGTMTDTGAWMLDVSTLLSGVYVATLYTATGGIPVRVLVKP